MRFELFLDLKVTNTQRRGKQMLPEPAPRDAQRALDPARFPDSEYARHAGK
jgi:hypothetical protein